MLTRGNEQDTEAAVTNGEREGKDSVREREEGEGIVVVVVV